MQVFRHRLLAAISILLPVLILFAPALLSDRSFAMRDAAHFYYPLFHWIGSAWQQGEFPLWNPYENCGMPLLADASSSLFYPGKVLFLLPLEFATQYKLYVVGHVLLAAAGMYRLARFHAASRPAAVIAAIAYACGGNVVFQHCNVVFLVGAAWLPWAWKPLWQALQMSNWPAAIRLSAILALMVLGGDPQMAYHVLLCGGGGLAAVGNSNLVETKTARRKASFVARFRPPAAGRWGNDRPLCGAVFALVRSGKIKRASCL